MATVYWDFSNSTWTTTATSYITKTINHWTTNGTNNVGNVQLRYRVYLNNSTNKLYLQYYYYSVKHTSFTTTRNGYLCDGSSEYGDSGQFYFQILKGTTNVYKYTPGKITSASVSQTVYQKLPKIQLASATAYNHTASEDGTSVAAPIVTEITSAAGSAISVYLRFAWARLYTVSGTKYIEWTHMAPLSSAVSLCTLPSISYKVTYKANGGTGSDVTDTKIPNVSLKLKTGSECNFSKSSTTNYTVTINANGGTSTVTSRTATKTTPYSVNTWNTASGGGGTSYTPGNNYTANAALTLYAQWTAGTATTTSVTLPTTSQCTRTGWTLLGFSASSTATAADSGLTPGASYTPTGNKTLYAVWRCTLKIYYHVNNGSIATGTGTTRYRAGSDGLVERSTDSGSTWADYYSTMYNYDAVKDLVNVATFGITRTGYYITGTTAWRTSGGTIISQESTSASDTNAATIVRLTGSASLSGDTSITLYVNWTSYTLTINFNVNGGSITTGTGTTRYRVSNDLVQVSENSGSTWSNLCNYLTNDEAYKNLWNVGTYGATKSGYDIVGNKAYRTGASSGNYINQDTASASDVNAATMANLTGSSILTADTTITLYINWEISQTVFVKVYINSEWKDAIPYVYISGVWKQAAPNLRIGSTWKN